VHLAYFDETGTDGFSPIVMFGALVVPTGKFGVLSSLHDVAIRQILPSDKIDEFGEFHAGDLYKGHGIFAGIDEIKRFTAIRVLLATLRMEKLSFIYSAVDRKRMFASPFGSTKPILTAFHMCLLGVEDWALTHHPPIQGLPEGHGKLIDWSDTYLCILDDCNDKKLKDEHGNIYRRLRPKHPFANVNSNRLWHAHDDMFFADSTDCIGVQLADLCAYFVRLHLEGTPEPENFFEMIATEVVCAKPEPEWSKFGELFRDHKGAIDGKRVRSIPSSNEENAPHRSDRRVPHP
jgi:hypothetical protein